MQSRWFWNAWIKNYKWLWYVLLGIFIFSFSLLWFNYIRGAESVIHWNKIQEQKIIESTVHTFHTGPFELTVPADNYVILEYFNGSSIQLNKFVLLAFVFVIIGSVIVILTVITTLDRFWYCVGMGLFIVFVVSLRLEVLSVFGQRNQTPAIVILSLYTLLSFYFQVLNKAFSFINRLISFSTLTLVLAVIIYNFAHVNFPMLHLSVTAYSAGLIISIIFILMVAHEIPAAFVYIVSQGGKKSLRHFSIISVIYIFNIIVTCLHEMGVIHWSFVYIDLYLLLSISAILGLWGFRQREVLYANILSFAPLGAYFFVALASICFITIAQLTGTANDPALRVIRDIIIFSHVGYGVIFLTYVFSNFILMLAQNMPAYKVLYKANRMPHFTFRLTGLIMTLGFVFYSNWHQYVYNSIAGFYNNIGDLYELLDKSAIAEAYYEQGNNYGFENNHANYALGKLKAARYNFTGTHKSYASANGRRPTEFSLANEGNIYLWENNIFGAITSLQQSLQKIPASSELNNNLGFAFGKVHNLDSAIKYLNFARNDNAIKPSAEANVIAITALEYLPIKSDSLLTIFDAANTTSLANALALATVQHQAFHTKVDVLAKKVLDLSAATLLNNYIIYNLENLDTTFINKAYKISSDSINSDYSEALKSSVAFAYYYQGNVARALQILGELAYLSQSYQGKYNYIMGLWALEQRNATLAASYFKYAVDADYKEGKLYYAIALSESGKHNDALVAWDTVANTTDEAANLMASKMKQVLNTKSNQAKSLNDADKYQYCRYILTVNDTLEFNRLVNTFKSDDYKAQALLDMSQNQFECGQLVKAIDYFSLIGGLKLSDKNLYQAVQHAELGMLAERKELRILAKQINKGVAFSPTQKLDKIYYTALLNEAANDTLHATKNYKILATYNPYFEEGIIAAASYFKVHSNDKLKAYNILVEAIQVNNSSVKLLVAYAFEAERMGFAEYATSAMQQVDLLKRNK